MRLKLNGASFLQSGSRKELKAVFWLMQNPRLTKVLLLAFYGHCTSSPASTKNRYEPYPGIVGIYGQLAMKLSNNVVFALSLQTISM